MTETVVAIRPIKRVFQPKLALDISTRDAVADYLRHRWPTHTVKSAARAYDLSLDEARAASEGRCSFNTYDKIKKTDRWSFVFAIEARVLEQTVESYLIASRNAHEERAERFAALLGNGGPVPAAGPPDPVSLGGEPAERRLFGRRGMGSR